MEIYIIYAVCAYIYICIAMNITYVCMYALPFDSAIPLL